MKPLLLLVFLIGCPAGDDDDSAPEGVDPLSWPVDEAGPFQVGYRTWEHSYTAPGGVGERTIPMAMWYPTEETAGAPVTYEGLFPDEQSFGNAIAAPPVHDGGYPVHLYSHGHQGFAGSSSFLARHLATHGWVTIAPDHIGNTLLTNTDPRATAIYFLRGTDSSQALDALDGVGAGFLAGTPDTSEVLLSGHSFGAHTVWSVGGGTWDYDSIEANCAANAIGDGTGCTPEELSVFAEGVEDSRIVSILPLAGAPSDSWFGTDGILDVQHPVFNMTGSEDPRNGQEMWERTVSLDDYSWIDIEGGCHQLFALGACDQVPSQEGFDIIGTYSLAFARKTVLGDASVSDILDGTTPVSDRVTLYTR